MGLNVRLRQTDAELTAEIDAKPWSLAGIFFLVSSL
jgi:hypothetical protein